MNGLKIYLHKPIQVSPASVNDSYLILNSV